jgi:hypothetical protein
MGLYQTVAIPPTHVVLGVSDAAGFFPPGRAEG